MTTTYLNDRASLANSLRDLSAKLEEIDATEEASRNVNVEKAIVARLLKDFAADLVEKVEQPSHHNDAVRYTHKRAELANDTNEILEALDAFDATRLAPDAANDGLKCICGSVDVLVDDLLDQ